MNNTQIYTNKKKKIIKIITVISIIVSLVVGPLVLNRPSEPVEVEKTQASSGSGNVITTIKDTDNTNLVENADAAKSLGAKLKHLGGVNETYRWTVELGRGTTYSFGLQEFGGIRPVVKMRNKEGWWVKYEMVTRLNGQMVKGSNGQKDINNLTIQPFNHYVRPIVDGNSIEWELAPGVIAKYTSLKDRIKADYIVNHKSSIINQRLDFLVEYNDSYAGDNGEELINGAGYLKHNLLPDGSITWLGENGGTVFDMPKPIIKEEQTVEDGALKVGVEDGGSKIDNQPSTLNPQNLPSTINPLSSNDLNFTIEKTGIGTSLLSINIPDGLDYPIIVDPVVVDSAAAATATAYGNGRKLLRDAWGNLIMLCSCGTGNDNVWYKNKSDDNANAGTWIDAGIDLDGGSGSSFEVAADLDSTGSAHVVFRDGGAGDVSYMPLAITRDSSNAISSIGTQALFDLDTALVSARPSLIVANKNEGAGKEKIAVAWAVNSEAGGTKQGEIRFLQCDVADPCNATANWKNASEAKNGSTNGMPTDLEVRGAADFMFAVDVHTTHHAVLTQVPGRPARTPMRNGAFKDINGTLTSLTNAIDDNIGTTADVNSLTNTDYIYVGDTVKFSRIVNDLTNTNSTGFNFSTRQYCSANSDVTTICDTWTAVANFIDNTEAGVSPNVVAFNEDGSILFDEPSGWIESTEGPGGSTAKGFWVRLRPSGAFDATVSVAEFDITDRHSKDLLIAGGVNDTDDLRASYVIWDGVAQDKWENIPGNTTAPAPWREDAGGASSALSNTGGNWTTFTNFPLTATPDLINNQVYVAYVDDLAADALTVERIPNNLSLTVTANWSDTVFPAVTEAGDIVLSLTSDQSDIYLSYVLDPDTNSLVWRKCTPSGGGDGNICDVAADWGSEISLSNNVDTTEEPVHPQAIVSKAYGDTVALDVVYTNNLATDTVKYERHLVDMRDFTKAVAASGDDAVQDKCISVSTDSQTISGTTVKLGGEATFGACSSGGVNHHVGFHFPSISVGQGANISSAYIDFRVSARTGGGTAAAFTVYGEDADNSAEFAAVADPCGATCIDGRTKTTSSSSQSIDFSTNSYRIDVTNMVQEIVCRGAADAQPCVGNFNGAGTWASGNALSMLLISTVGASNNNASIDAFDATGTVMLDPTLQINCAGSGCGTGNPRINYSMGVLKPPTGSGDLDHPMSASQFGQATTDDSLYASVSASLVSSASPSATPTYMFKVNNSNNNNTDRIRATAIVKTNQAEEHARSPTHLQVYRGGSFNGWITLFSTAVNIPTDTDITLDSGPILTNLSDYYQAEVGPNLACSSSSANCWVYFRIYQDPPTDNFNEVLYVDYFNTTFGVFADTNIQTQIRGGTTIRGGTRVQ